VCSTHPHPHPHPLAPQQISGEALCGEQGFGVDPYVLMSVAEEVAAAVRAGVRIAIVVCGAGLPACLPARLPACLHACLPACMPACTPARLHACLHACTPARLPACLPACLHACTLAHMHDIQATPWSSQSCSSPHCLPGGRGQLLPRRQLVGRPGAGNRGLCGHAGNRHELALPTGGGRSPLHGMRARRVSCAVAGYGQQRAALARVRALCPHTEHIGVEGRARTQAGGHAGSRRDARNNAASPIHSCWSKRRPCMPPSRNPPRHTHPLDAERPGAEGRAHARADGHRDARGGGALHPAPRHQPPEAGAGGDFWCGHGEPFLHHRHGGGTAGGRGGGGGGVLGVGSCMGAAGREIAGGWGSCKQEQAVRNTGLVVIWAPARGGVSTTAGTAAVGPNSGCPQPSSHLFFCCCRCRCRCHCCCCCWCSLSLPTVPAQAAVCCPIPVTARPTHAGQCRGVPQGHQGGWRVRQRPQEEPQRAPLREAVVQVRARCGWCMCPLKATSHHSCKWGQLRVSSDALHG